MYVLFFLLGKDVYACHATALMKCLIIETPGGIKGREGNSYIHVDKLGEIMMQILMVSSPRST